MQVGSCLTQNSVEVHKVVMKSHSTQCFC